MPAMLDDPTAPIKVRMSEQGPYPLEIVARQFTLRDRVTTATLVPFSNAAQVPASLVSYLCDQLNKEIEKGDTYPMIDHLSSDAFGPYWFGNFGAVMLLGDFQQVDDMLQTDGATTDWAKECLGSFYIKPNYPGRSSHVCNGGFLVTDAARNKGVGRLMGEGYLDWAPKVGYTYSVFNLVYETNVASCRIWDALGFKRIGRVKECGNLRSYPDRLVDAIIYGRDLGPEGEDYVSEERFDKIKYYLKHGKYPNGADRAEKSRLRSAATHYRLLPGDDPTQDRLMLKDKEVISDPQRQYEIAKIIHSQHHGGINKTTATIAEKFHWVRIKETVSLVIRNCPECKELSKAAPARNDDTINSRVDASIGGQDDTSFAGDTNAAEHQLSLSLQQSHEDDLTLALKSSMQHSIHVDPPQHAMHGLPSQHDHSALVASSIAYQYPSGYQAGPELMQNVHNTFGSYDQVNDTFWTSAATGQPGTSGQIDGTRKQNGSLYSHAGVPTSAASMGGHHIHDTFHMFDHGLSEDSQVLSSQGHDGGHERGTADRLGTVNAQEAAQATLSEAEKAQLNTLKQQWGSTTAMDGAPRDGLS